MAKQRLAEHGAGHRTKRVGCVILAAGWSRRMGVDIQSIQSQELGSRELVLRGQKLLLPVCGNVPMVRRVADIALHSRVSFTIMVVNPAFPEVTQVLADLPVEILQNHDTDGGMSTSFQLGIAALERENANAGLFLLADQPGMEQKMIDKVLSAYECCDSEIVQACYHGVPGHPVLFDGSLFPYAAEAKGDEGGRHLFRRFAGKRTLVEMGMQAPGDVDTMADYKSFLAHEKGS